MITSLLAWVSIELPNLAEWRGMSYVLNDHEDLHHTYPTVL